MDHSHETTRTAAQPDSTHEFSDSALLPTRLDQWLTTLVAKGGSDLLLIAKAPACIRREGEVLPIETDPLEGPEIEAAVLPALTLINRRTSAIRPIAPLN